MHACDGADATACVELAEIYRFGSAGPRDLVKARALYERACTPPGGPFDGCVGLAELHCAVDDSKTRRQGVDLLIRVCELNNAPACSLVGLYYSEGLCGVPYNGGSFMRGAEYYTRGCDLGRLAACTHLGLLYRSGHGVQRDEARGTQLLKDACVKGESPACEYAKQK